MRSHSIFIGSLFGCLLHEKSRTAAIHTKAVLFMVLPFILMILTCFLSRCLLFYPDYTPDRVSVPSRPG